MSDTYALLDTRITAEFWLAGDGVTPRKRNAKLRKLQKKGGDYRPMIVRLADGEVYRVGSYLADERHAVADAIRLARSRAMETRFRADAERRLADARAEGARLRAAWNADSAYDGPKWWDVRMAPDPFPFVPLTVPGEGFVSTRACEVPAVVSVTCDGVELLPILEEAKAPAKRASRDPFARFSDDDLWAELERREEARRPRLAIAA